MNSVAVYRRRGMTLVELLVVLAIMGLLAVTVVPLLVGNRDKKSVRNAADAAEALRLTAQDLLKLGIIDKIVAEPLGGAHRKRDEIIARVGEAISEELEPLLRADRKTLLADRREKFLSMGKKSLN